ncbi:hypothetical protein VTO73DRAFT_14188 [Trametes versicolor]
MPAGRDPKGPGNFIQNPDMLVGCCGCTSGDDGSPLRVCQGWRFALEDMEVTAWWDSDGWGPGNLSEGATGHG